LCFVKRVVRALFRSGFLVGLDQRLDGFVAAVVPPVGLHEHGVDLFETDGPGLVADGFDQGTDAKVFDRPQGAIGAAQDELDGVFGEGGVGQAGEVELVLDVVAEGGRRKGVEFGGVGDAAFEVELSPELKGCVEGGLADEDWKRMSFQNKNGAKRSKSSRRRRNLWRASTGRRWASSMMGTRVFPLEF